MKELFERTGGQELASSQELHLILDALPVPLSWASVPGGNIKFVNRAFVKTFGYAVGQFATVDQWIDETYQNPDHRALARESWEGLWLARKPGISEVGPIEIDIRCTDGSTRTVLHRGIMLHDKGVGIATFEDITARKQAETALWRFANLDPLTGLPNRRRLEQRWQEVAGDTLMAFLLIDLDDFKKINDTFGHNGGDEALRAVALRLQACVRTGDTVCRLGGDEFGILLPAPRDTDQVAAICNRIIARFNEPVMIDGRPCRFGISAGASLYPVPASNLQDILKRADTALYRTKSSGKGAWDWCEASKAA